MCLGCEAHCFLSLYNGSILGGGLDSVAGIMEDAFRNMAISDQRGRMPGGNARRDRIELAGPSRRSERALVTDVLEAKVVVGLDFGTTYTGFAYSFKKSGGRDIYTFYDYAAMPKPYCKTMTVLYYKPSREHPGGWRLQSWGHPARINFDQDYKALLRWESLNNGGAVVNSPKPVVGSFLTRFKLILAMKQDAPPIVKPLPSGLTVDRVITDYLREIGGLVLATLRKTSAGLTKQDIQWCITVPSIWDNSAKERMRNCMIDAGLVDGVDGSPHPLMIVLEPEAASYHCYKYLRNGVLNTGDRVLVADIGGGTADLVMQKALDVGANYRVEEVTRSSGGLCGGIYVDSEFLSYLHRRIGPCLKEVATRSPGITQLLLRNWETLKVGFSGSGDSVELDLPRQLADQWEKYDMEMGFERKEDYGEVVISDIDLEQIFRPVVERNLSLVAAQLDQVKAPVKVLLVVGGFSSSLYLLRRIREAFKDRVPHIFSPENPGSTICQGAVALAFRPEVVVNRISRVTYGVACTRNFENGIDPPEFGIEVDGALRCENRFSVFVKKGTSVRAQQPFRKVYRPVFHGQTKMTFDLYSSTEEEPRYTVGDTVMKEGTVEIDISSGLELGRDRQVELSLFFGRTSIEVKAEAINFANFGDQHIDLPVKFGYA